MVRVVQRIAPCGQQLHRLANAAWLINAALLADGQVHGEVQKRVGAIRRGFLQLGQRLLQVGKLGVVLRVLVNPLAGNDLYRLHRLTRTGLGVNITKESANVGL